MARPAGGRVYFFAAGARRVSFFCLRGRFAHSLAAGAGLGNPIRGLCGAGAGGGAFIFLLRVHGAFFFFAVGAPLPGPGPVRRNPMGRGPASRGRVYFFAAFFFLLWVRGRFAHSLAAGAGRGNPIRGLCGPGGGGRVYFFAVGARRVFFFCCGCALARAWAGQAESNGAWAGQQGARLFFAAGARRVSFFACAAGSLTHLLPGRASGIQLGACAGRGGGGAFIFLLWVRGAFFFLLWVRPCPGPPTVRRNPMGGAFIFLLRVRGAFFLLWVRELTHSLTRCPPPGEHQQQKSTHNKKKNTGSLLGPVDALRVRLCPAFSTMSAWEC